MTIEMEEFETLKHKFYESFAKEYGITLKEDTQTSVAETAAADALEGTASILDDDSPIMPGMAEDSTHQEGAIKEEGQSELVFEAGNLDLLEDSLKVLVRKPGIIARTLLPLIEKALIEELGSSSSYKRKNFNFNIALSNNQIIYDISILYEVDLFIGTDVDPTAVKHDEDYIINTISAIPNIRIKQVKINTANGEVQIAVEV